MKEKTTIEQLENFVWVIFWVVFLSLFLFAIKNVFLSEYSYFCYAKFVNPGNDTILYKSNHIQEGVEKCAEDEPLYKFKVQKVR